MLNKYDPTPMNVFVNKLAINLVSHLRTLYSDAKNPQIEIALDYIETNNPEHRKTYVYLKRRIETLRNICKAFIDDPAMTPETQLELTKLFPDLTPADKPPVVTIVKEGPVPAPSGIADPSTPDPSGK